MVFENQPISSPFPMLESTNFNYFKQSLSPVVASYAKKRSTFEQTNSTVGKGEEKCVQPTFLFTHSTYSYALCVVVEHMVFQ